MTTIRRLLPLLLVLSIGLNVWQWSGSRHAAASHWQEAVREFWGANYWLNAFVNQVSDPAVDWDDLGFRFSLAQTLDRATIYAQAAGSALGLRGDRWRVSAALNSLGFDLTDLGSAAARLVLSAGAAPDESRAKLLAFASHLTAAGWPIESPSLADAEGWSRMADSLEGLLQRMHGGGSPG